MSHETALAALARELAPFLIAELAKMSAPEYASAPADRRPARCRSTRQARDRIRRVPGHRREGNGPATVWYVSREAYHAFYTHRKVDAPPASSTRLSDDEIASSSLEEANLRSTRRAS